MKPRKHLLPDQWKEFQDGVTRALVGAAVAISLGRLINVSVAAIVICLVSAAFLPWVARDVRVEVRGVICEPGYETLWESARTMDLMEEPPLARLVYIPDDGSDLRWGLQRALPAGFLLAVVYIPWLPSWLSRLLPTIIVKRNHGIRVSARCIGVLAALIIVNTISVSAQIMVDYQQWTSADLFVGYWLAIAALGFSLGYLSLMIISRVARSRSRITNRHQYGANRP